MQFSMQLYSYNKNLENQENFINLVLKNWKNFKALENAKLCKDYENGGLKNVYITFNIISLQCFWVKRLYDSSTHDWKLIPLHIIPKS